MLFKGNLHGKQRKMIAVRVMRMGTTARQSSFFNADVVVGLLVLLVLILFAKDLEKMSATGIRINIELMHGFSLTEIRSSDIYALIQHLSNRLIYETTLNIPYPYGHTEAKQFVQVTENASREFEHPVHFAIRHADGLLIGVCGLQHLIPNQTAEIGYWVAEPYWGRGIATATVQATCTMVRRAWNLDWLYADVFEGNQASRRVLEKSGFDLVSLQPTSIIKDGRLIALRRFARQLDSIRSSR